MHGAWKSLVPGRLWCMRVCVCVRACVRAYVNASVCVPTGRVCVHACVCVPTMRVYVLRASSGVYNNAFIRAGLSVCFVMPQSQSFAHVASSIKSHGHVVLRTLTLTKIRFLFSPTLYLPSDNRRTGYLTGHVHCSNTLYTYTCEPTPSRLFHVILQCAKNSQWLCNITNFLNKHLRVQCSSTDFT